MVAFSSILSQQGKRKWRAFLRQKRAGAGLFVFILLFFFALTAEFWTNSSPLLLIRGDSVTGENSWYFPFAIHYVPQDFDIEFGFTVDYKELEANDRDENKDSFYLWAFNRWSPHDTVQPRLAPSSQHYFGTDEYGRDVFCLVLYGTRMAILFGFAMWSLSLILGMFIGGVQGYLAGRLDFFIERYKELTVAVPTIVLLVVMQAVFEVTSFWIIVLSAVAWNYWQPSAEQMRAQFLSLRKKEFCEAGLALGGGHFRVMFKHIFPNAITPILSISPFLIIAGANFITILDYLGYGLGGDQPSLGELLRQGQARVREAPWIAIFPSLALLCIIFSINLIGESLREAFDPKANA